MQNPGKTLRQASVVTVIAAVSGLDASKMDPLSPKSHYWTDDFVTNQSEQG